VDSCKKGTGTETNYRRLYESLLQIQGKRDKHPASTISGLSAVLGSPTQSTVNQKQIPPLSQQTPEMALLLCTLLHKMFTFTHCSPFSERQQTWSWSRNFKPWYTVEGVRDFRGQQSGPASISSSFSSVISRRRLPPTTIMTLPVSLYLRLDE
jgi:hypothetical protein